VEGAIKGMVEALGDPYAQYFTAEQLSELERTTAGRLTGIGAQLTMKDGRLTVVTPLDDSPALKAGLRPGDVITGIDGKPSKGLTVTEAVKRVIGPAGSDVKLTLERDGKEETLTITRAQVHVRSAQGFRRGPGGHWNYRLDPEAGVGYVRVLAFGPTTAREVRAAVEGLKKQGLKALVLDLRFCPGGLLAASVDTAKLFLSKGTIVSVKGREAEENKVEAGGKDTLGDFPLVVLINEHTASAAEVLAGALRDNDRAVLLGTRSFGKGSVQSVIKLEGPGGAVKLTSAQYRLPSGRSIDRRPGSKTWGVDPTDGYYVPTDPGQMRALLESMRERDLLGTGVVKEEKITPDSLSKTYADPELASALRTLTARLSKGAFEKVGKPAAVMEEQLARGGVARQRRDALLKDLERINRELADLDKQAGDPVKPLKDK